MELGCPDVSSTRPKSLILFSEPLSKLSYWAKELQKFKFNEFAYSILIEVEVSGPNCSGISKSIIMFPIGTLLKLSCPDVRLCVRRIAGLKRATHFEFKKV